MTTRNQDPTAKPGTIDYEEEQASFMRRYEEKNGVPHPGFHDTHDDPDRQLPKSYANEIPG